MTKILVNVAITLIALAVLAAIVARQRKAGAIVAKAKQRE